MPHSVTVTPSPPLQATLQAATRRLAPVNRLARGLFPSSRVREEPCRVLGPILLEIHHEYSRIEGARLGDLFISRQGLRAPPPISLHQLDLLSLHQQQSEVYQEVIRGNQRSSEAISLHQHQSEIQSEVYQGQSHAFMRAMCMSA